MVGMYDTYPVRGTNGDVCYLGCSFDKKCVRVSNRWEIHKGKLLSKFSEPEKSIVKVCLDPQRCHEECTAEVRKMDMVALALQKCPNLRKIFAVAETYETTVNKDKGFGIGKKKNRQKTVHDGTKVLVQERHDGHIQTFLDIDAETNPCWEPGSRSPFHELCLAVYNVSGGQYAVFAIKGVNLERCQVKRADGRDYGNAKYLITSVRAHSVDKEFGSQDRGMDGIKAFVKCAGTALPTEPLANAKDFADKLRTRRASKAEEPRWSVSSDWTDTDSLFSSSFGSSSAGSRRPSTISCVSSCQCREHGCDRSSTSSSSSSSSSSSKDSKKVKESHMFMGILEQVFNPPDSRPFTFSRYSIADDYDKPGYAR